MPKALRTQPFDVVVAIRALRPWTTLAPLAEELAVAPSQVHASLRRLELAGLLRPDGRSANPRALADWILGGLRHCFPVHRGPLADGVPTAYSAPPLGQHIDALDALVWPAPPTAALRVRGFAITPLYPKAWQLVERSPDVYGLLTLVDAIRLGDPRLRAATRDLLEPQLLRRGEAGTATPKA